MGVDGKVLVVEQLQRRSIKKSEQQNKGNSKVRERRRSCLTAVKVSPLYPLDDPRVGKWIFPNENCDLWSAHAGAGEKCEEKGAREGN